MKRIGLVHAVAPAIAPIHTAFAREWPQARLQNVHDDGLTTALQEEGAITTRIHERILRLAQVASDGADAVLFTCTAFDAAIDAARACLGVPVLKPNEAMYEAGLARGERVGLLATFEPAVSTMEQALIATAGARGMQVSVRSVYVAHALDAARQGDVARHNALVASAARALAGCDVLLLGQFSTSTALQATQQAVAQPVLSAPEAAVLRLKRSFGVTENQ